MNIALNLLDYGLAECAYLDPCECFRISAFMAVLDMLSSGVDKKAKTYSEVSNRYGFLCNLAVDGRGATSY